MKATRPTIIAAGRPNAVDATCVWPQCHGTQYVSFPLCAKHVYDVYSRVAEAKARPKVEHAPVRPPRRVTGALGLVYFMQFGPNVKIGFTRNLKERVKNLRPDKVLGVMDGTTKDERALHAKFGPHWIDGEYFRLTSDIMEFIESNARAE